MKPSDSENGYRKRYEEFNKYFVKLFSIIQLPIAELRKWLNRPELSFIENLDFGMKVWNSIEFVLLSKQEIIVDEFCNNLTKLRKEIAASKVENYSKTAWSKVNEFLSFRYSSGAVNATIKAKLVKTLSDEAEITINESRASSLVLNALLTTLQNPSIQNYYKSNANDYAKFLGVNIRYITVLLQSNNVTNDERDQFKQQIEEILSSMRLYIKQTPFLEVFKSTFAKEILQVLCELVIWSNDRNISFKKEFLNILQELYFNGSQTKQMKHFFSNKKPLTGHESTIKEFQDIFNVPMHVFLLVIETVILSFRNDFEVQQLFFRYLLNEYEGKLSTYKNGINTQLSGLTVFICLLKKYEVPLKFEIDSVKAHVYLGKYIENVVNAYFSTLPHEVLNLLCATLRLDPLILEFSVCQIAVKFMLMPKNDELVWTKYEEFMFLVIEMYRKLSRAEKFISQLIKNLYETLSTMKLSKKLKRSFNTTESSTPSKKLKKSTEEVVPMEILGDGDAIEDQHVILLQNSINKECESLSKINVPSRKRNNQIWSDIAFAFSPAISGTYTKFISGLVTKPSLVVWKSLIFTLKDYIQQLKEADGKCSENCIFLVEITCALLSQYFMGSRVAEQSDKSWDAIETNRNATREVLTDFGHAILNQEHNSRTMNSFLKLSHSASNFDLVCWYYRPDSMQISSGDDNDSIKFDVNKCIRSIHAYLTEKEWTTIEQRITNFGKRECKANINKIYLQRLKAIQLFESSSDNDVGKFVLSSAFGDIEQISDILCDPSLSNWFIDNLNSNQKRMVCELLLQKSDDIAILKELGTINNLEFIEILIFSAYKKLIEILAAGKNCERLAKINFEQIFEDKTEEVCKYMSSVLGDRVGDKKHIKNSLDEIASLLKLLDSLPIGFCKPKSKSILSLLNIIVYHYLKDGAVTELNVISVNIFKGMILYNFRQKSISNSFNPFQHSFILEKHRIFSAT